MPAVVALDFSAAPESGRRATILAALQRLHAVTRGKAVRIAEVGTIRDKRPIAAAADGWALRIWAWYAGQVNGWVHTIDSDPRAIAAARSVMTGSDRSVTYHTGPAQVILPALLPVDLLYMDGPPEAAAHLDIWRAIARTPPRLVLFDDILDPATYAVKGALAVPAMLAAGYRVLFARDRQALLEFKA